MLKNMLKNICTKCLTKVLTAVGIFFIALSFTIYVANQYDALFNNPSVDTIKSYSAATLALACIGVIFLFSALVLRIFRLFCGKHEK